MTYVVVMINLINTIEMQRMFARQSDAHIRRNVIHLELIFIKYIVKIQHANGTGIL